MCHIAAPVSRVADIMGRHNRRSVRRRVQRLALVEGGKLISLATTAPERSALMPDVPTTTKPAFPACAR